MTVPLELGPTLGDLPALVLLALAGFVASAINAVAGGGSLVSFPALIALGVPSVPANATNAFALAPGSLGSALGLRNQLARTRRHLAVLLPPTIAGSILGAWLLGHTPEAAFRVLVPALILLATVLLGLQPRIRRWSLDRPHHASPALVVVLQLAVSVYGGYFGAGMGILMLAVMGLFIEGTIHELNAVKAWLGLVINGLAAVLFLVQGLVATWPALAVMLGAIAGGYVAGRVSQRIDPERLRRATVVLGAVMTAWFTWRVVVE